MATLTVTTRRTKSGKRFVVRYRLGGRAYPIQHGGSFKTLREARARRDFIAGELAARRNPAETLRQPEQVERRSFSTWAQAWLASRIDVSQGTRDSYEMHLRTIVSVFGTADPQAITWQDVQEWISESGLKSIKTYLVTLRAVLDYADVSPNPARDDRIRLPYTPGEDINPPSAKQFRTLLAASASKYVVLLVTLEQTAMRVGEACSLAWGDVDAVESRFRLSASRTKTKKARWVQVPAWLMDLIAETCPLEDRTAERKVFLGLTPAGALKAMRRACQESGLPHFHPHDLRHRRGTIWHHEGVPARVASDRLGHSRTSMTLDTYTHLMPPGEVSAEELAALVWSRCGLGAPNAAESSMDA